MFLRLTDERVAIPVLFMCLALPPEFSRRTSKGADISKFDVKFNARLVR